MSRLIIVFDDPDMKFSPNEKTLLKGLMDEKFNRLVGEATFAAYLRAMIHALRLSRGQPTSKEEPSLTVGSDYLRDTAEGVRAWAEELFPGLRVSVTLLPSKF